MAFRARLIASNGFCVSILLLWCFALFFYGMDAGELWRTEGLRAIIAQQMLRSGNWIVPTLYGEPLFTKPPGMYAAIALCSWPFGQVTEISARLPSALAATATVLLFYWYFRRQLGNAAGLCAALILPMSPMWLDKASSAEIDMLQVFWVTAAILFFLRAIDVGFCERRGLSPPEDEATRSATSARRDKPGGTWWWFAALLCVAGGLLTKWTAPVLFYLTALPLLWRRRQLRLLWSWPHLVSATLALTICLSWMAAAIALEGWDIFYQTVKREALYRLVPNYAEDPYPWHETLLHPLRILVTTLPWSLLALWTLRPGFSERLDQRLLEAMHCWLWPNLVFFSLATEHTPRHSFPFFPAIAGLAALVIVSRRPRWTPRPVFIASLAIWLVLKVAFVQALVPHRNANRDPRAKGAMLAALVPVETILYLFSLKDEGIMFYYGRPVQRLQSPEQLPNCYHDVYCILKENECRDWTSDRPITVVQRLVDQQGDAIVLVRVGPSV